MRFPRSILLPFAAGVCLAASVASADQVSIRLAAAPDNPASPQMGDNLYFTSVIHNETDTAIDGLIAWISLVQVDAGKEQPVDLEDWSAHKAVTASSLAPGESIETDWPMRLIQAGNYRVVISATDRAGPDLVASNFADFAVRQKAVVDSTRVLPISLGLPLLLAGLMIWRRPRRLAPRRPASGSISAHNET